MNRNNSVEPIYSQPLQQTYSQLLVSKTKIEEELYQAQRQLKRKEGEFMKKIAVYEQKIDQMKEQINDYSNRETSMKAMYEKILSALNMGDDNGMSYILDMDRMVGYLRQISNSMQGSPSSSKNKFSKQQSSNDFSSDTQQSENQDSSLQSLTYINEKLKSELREKDKENQELLQQINSIKTNFEVQTQENAFKVNNQINEAKQRLELQITQVNDENIVKINQITQEYESKIEELQQQLQSFISNNEIEHFQQQLFQSSKEILQLKDLSARQEKEKQEMQMVIERLKKEKERDDDVNIKEKEQMKDFMSSQEQIINKLKKQMNTNTTNNNEATKRLKQKLSECEKELEIKNEEITKLKNKIQIQIQTAKATETLFQEKRNSGAHVKQNKQGINVGSKEQQVIVEIQTIDKSKKGLGSKQLTKGGKANQNFPKMFAQNISNRNSNVNINDGVSVSQSINSSNLNSSQIQASKQNISINSSYLPQYPSQKFSQTARSVTPNNRIRQSHQIKNIDKNSVNNFDESTSSCQQNQNSNGHNKQNPQLLKYINVTSRNEINNLVSTDQSELAYYHQNQNIQTKQMKRNSTDRSQIVFQNDYEKLLYSSLEIEEVVKNILDQAKVERVEATPLQSSQYYNMQQTPSQNVSFSMRKQSCNEETRQFMRRNSFTIDREFLTKLEVSLKKLAKSNEKIKQMMKEKETLEKICQKLKAKVKQLKEDKNSMQLDRENLISQNHKLECRLKQAQVILNVEGDNNAYGNNHQSNCNQINPNNTIYEQQNHFSSQKNLIKGFSTKRDTSPTTCKLTLNIVSDQPINDRYTNRPNTCRVNDSYDISLRLANEGIKTQKRPMFLNTQEKSMLDQSIQTIKKDLQTSSNQSHQSKMQNQPKFQVQSSTIANSTKTTSRGKTPTLKINLSSAVQDGPQQISNSRVPTYRSNEREDPNSVLTSRNFSRSTNNLLHKKSPQTKSQYQKEVNGNCQVHQPPLQRYQSTRECPIGLQRSPSNNNNGGTFGQLTKQQSPKNTCFEQPGSFTLSNNSGSQSSSANLIKKIGVVNKAKDRYYNRRNDDFSQANNYMVDQRMYRPQHIITFDEQEEMVNHIEEHDNEYVNRDQFDQDYVIQSQDSQSYDIINGMSRSEVDPQSQIDCELIQESTLNIKFSKKYCHDNSGAMGFNETSKFRDILKKRDEGFLLHPDEREYDEEESIQYKLLNNSNFNPSMHSRYINEDSQ